MAYIIKDKKHNNFFNRKLKIGFHFVQNIKEAHVFKNKREANSILKTLKAKDNYELISIHK